MKLHKNRSCGRGCTTKSFLRGDSTTTNTFLQQFGRKREVQMKWKDRENKYFFSCEVEEEQEKMEQRGKNTKGTQVQLD